MKKQRSLAEIFEITAKYMAFTTVPFDVYEYGIERDQHVFTHFDANGDGQTCTWVLTTDELEMELNGDGTFDADRIPQPPQIGEKLS